jgi:hypothetical protein
MNLASPLFDSAAGLAGVLGDAVASLLGAVADLLGFLPDDGPDGGLGMVMSGLAGVAAALAVTLALTIYFRTGYRSARDIVRHGVAANAALGLLLFVAYDIRHAALAFLGINPSKPAVEFEIRLPKAAVPIAADTQIELHTDRNQTLAHVQGALASPVDGGSVLRGSVPLEYRTTNRVVILNLPGQACEFKLRLAANPSHSDTLGPWHLADRVASLARGEAAQALPTDGFAIRYRVL